MRRGSAELWRLHVQVIYGQMKEAFHSVSISLHYIIPVWHPHLTTQDYYPVAVNMHSTTKITLRIELVGLMGLPAWERLRLTVAQLVALCISWEKVQLCCFIHLVVIHGCVARDSLFLAFRKDNQCHRLHRTQWWGLVLLIENGPLPVFHRTCMEPLPEKMARLESTL